MPLENTHKLLETTCQHSPAKTGPLKDLHKIKISETIADAIKPMPIIKAMNNALNLKTGGTKANVRGASSGSVVINYNPTINLSGSTPSAKDDFAQMLKKTQRGNLEFSQKRKRKNVEVSILMFAQLGDIEFELITYFNGMNESQSYNYAQHERINQKPVLQFLGLNLQEQDIKLNFHASFCTPEDEIKKLKDVANLGTPLKFIKGNGDYVGVFCHYRNRICDRTSHQ